jgi:hypothetical protein
MKRFVKKGLCTLCLGHIDTTEIKKHIVTHIKNNEENKAYLLKISSENISNKYWFYVIIKKNETLASLEEFIKKTWFMNCNHDGYFYDANNLISIDTPINNIKYIEYKYDKDNPTILTIFSCDKLNSNDNLILVARNLPIKYVCSCRIEAKVICTNCENFFCSRCFEQHRITNKEKKCNSYFDIINSPRMNMCYTCPIKNFNSSSKKN